MAQLILRPNVDYTALWTCSSGTNRYALVDESSADDADYIYISGTSIQNFSFPNHTSESGTINSVTIVARAKHSATTQMALYISGAGSSSPQINVNPSYADIPYVMATNPLTQVAWIWDNVDNYYFGIKGTKSGTCYCSQYYIVVDYTPPAGGGLTIPIMVGGAWKNSTAQQIMVGGVWKNITAAQIMVGGVWKAHP